MSQTTNNNSNNNFNAGAGFSLAFGLPSLGINNTNNMQQLPMLGMMGFPGTSPNSWMGNANDFYGYAPSTSIHNNYHYHHLRNDSTPEVPPLNDIKMENGHGGNDCGDGRQHQQQQQRISGIGMTPLVFQQHRVPTHQQLLQVVSTDSQTDDYLKKASSHPPLASSSSSCPPTTIIHNNTTTCKCNDPQDGQNPCCSTAVKEVGAVSQSHRCWGRITFHSQCALKSATNTNTNLTPFFSTHMNIILSLLQTNNT